MQEESLRLSERVEPEAFSQRLISRLGDAVGDVHVKHRHIYMTVARERVVEVARILHTDPELSFDFLTFLSAVDWEDQGFDVVLTVLSTRFENTAIIKVRLPRDDPRMDSLTGIYPGANWHERETAEMFGITFEGHPNPKNLYLSDDFIGHPLRKDFKLASRTYKAWPGAKDPDEAAGGGR